MAGCDIEASRLKEKGRFKMNLPFWVVLMILVDVMLPVIFLP